ncbi:MAG: type II secretion system protein [Patescibacteria group bacterium]
MKKQRGFTLIELLVVIAIIGILSAVVLASLNSARSKGADASIQSNLKTVQIQAELYYSDNSNSYGTQAFGATIAACTGAGMFGNTTIKGAMNAAYSAGGSAAGSVACVANASTYAIAAKLVGTSASSWWCVDSSGASKVVLTGTTAFPVASFTCP